MSDDSREARSGAHLFGALGVAFVVVLLALLCSYALRAAWSAVPDTGAAPSAPIACLAGQGACGRYDRAGLPTPGELEQCRVTQAWDRKRADAAGELRRVVGRVVPAARLHHIGPDTPDEVLLSWLADLRAEPTWSFCTVESRGLPYSESFVRERFQQHPACVADPPRCEPLIWPVRDEAWALQRASAEALHLVEAYQLELDREHGRERVAHGVAMQAWSTRAEENAELLRRRKVHRIGLVGVWGIALCGLGLIGWSRLRTPRA